MHEDGYDRCFCPDGTFDCSNEPPPEDNSIGGACTLDEEDRWGHTCDRWDAKCEDDSGDLKCFCPDDTFDCAGEDAPAEPAVTDPATGMECTMDGYVNLVANGMNVALAGLSILRQIGSSFLPADLRKAVEYAWRGVLGAGSWVGFALAAGYFAAEEFGYGETFCMVMGYGNIALEYGNEAVNLLETLRDMIPI